MRLCLGRTQPVKQLLFAPLSQAMTQTHLLIGLWLTFCLVLLGKAVLVKTLLGKVLLGKTTNSYPLASVCHFATRWGV